MLCMYDAGGEAEYYWTVVLFMLQSSGFKFFVFRCLHNTDRKNSAKCLTVLILLLNIVKTLGSWRDLARGHALIKNGLFIRADFVYR